MKNPLYAQYFADPFVLRHNGEYYAYGTGPDAGQGVPVLHSRDLVNWHAHGVALADPAHIWAPEVAYRDGLFYMYYSVGGPEGEGHQLRVATSASPLGPFVRAGEVLTPQEAFSIDASPFQDEDGSWYLFFCLDFLEGERVGTGIVVDRLVSMDRLAHERRVAVRAHADWQIFQRNRHWYERTWDAWYTVEGPFAVRRNGKIYLFFSGGAWKESNYGLSYAVADHPLGPYEVKHLEAPPLLSTVPGQIIGPGHASVVTGPDGVQQFIAYHAWDPAHTGRTLRMEPLVWDGDEPTCPGARLDEQPDPKAPLMPQFRALSGDWSFAENRAGQLSAQSGRAQASLPAGDFRAQAWVRALNGHGRAGFEIGGTSWLAPVGYCLRHLQVERRGSQLTLHLDGALQPLQSLGTDDSFSLLSEEVPVMFTGVSLTTL